jgi:hypothetical protein
MTPAQVAADLEAIVSTIEHTFDRDGDRQYCLEQVQARLAELAAKLRTGSAPHEMAEELTAGLDGPHADEHTTGAAELAAEAIRFLNYATGPHASGGLTYPATVYSVTASLAVAAARLPQLCDQLTRWLDAENAAGRLGDDHGGPVAVLADRARFHLDSAAGHATALHAALAGAQAAVATVHQTTGGPTQ